MVEQSLELEMDIDISPQWVGVNKLAIYRVNGLEVVVGFVSCMVVFSFY